MGRGIDGENLDQTKVRRDLLRRSISSRDEDSADSLSASRAAEEEKKKRVMKARENLEEEKKKRAREAREKLEEERKALEEERKALLGEYGIFEFPEDSPAEQALSEKGYHESDYEVKVVPTEDTLLEEAGDFYAYKVTLDGKQTEIEGLAADEDEAKKKAVLQIKATAKKKVSVLKKEQNSFMKKQREDQREEKKQEEENKKKEERKELLSGLQATPLPFFPTGTRHPLVWDDNNEVQRLQRDTVGDFDIVSFVGKGRVPLLYIFKDGQVIAATNHAKPTEIYGVKKSGLTNSGQTWRTWTERSGSYRKDLLARLFPERGRHQMIKEAKRYIVEFSKKEGLSSIK